MSDSGVKIEVHLIQNFAPSNLNRDDTGQPKSATFGGFRRARVSSQCGKRAVREWWRERGTVTVGDRTKKLQQILFTALQEDQSFLKDEQDADFLKDGIRVFTDAYYANADKKRPEQTSVLIFIAPGEVQVCAKAIRDLWDDKEKAVTKKSKTGEETKETIDGIASVVEKCRQHDAKAANKKKDTQQAPKPEDGSESAEAAQSDEKKDNRPKLKPVDEVADRIKKAQVSADIALFGRMLAEQPGRNTDGACQVAHPISTHKVDMEMDFYTAVDDLNPAEETGAGMMGVVGFNSACYYRYALVDRDQLARNLARKTERKDGGWAVDLEKDDYTEADKVIKAFLEAMVCAIPTGKQNSFAAQNLPSFGLFVRRQGGVPVSLANAFAKPVRPSKVDDDLVGMSVAALTKHWDAVKKVYGDQGVRKTACFHLNQESRLNGLSDSDKGNVVDAIEAVMTE
jgi:CRISPR system Cascade subunit CasC